MDSIEQMLEHQKTIGESIQNLIRNYKKDSADRKKTARYFEEREQRLQELWDQFQDTDSEIRDVCKEPMKLEYFAKGYYEQIRTITLDHIKVFSQEAKRIKQQASEQPRTSDSAKTKLALQDITSAGSHEVSDNASGIVRRLNARLTALSRLMNGLSVTESNPLQYFELKIQTIKNLWEQIELLHDEAYNEVSNPRDYGLNQDEYDGVNDLVQTSLVNLSIEADKLRHNYPSLQNGVAASTTNSTKNNALHLPKVTIPQFDGNYLKWRQFHDLFSEMVDKQPIPAIQKMWYLKSNLSGEAEHIISHFSLSESNYNTAWKTLQERYNNKRILVATLVEKILNQPTASSSTSSLKALHDTTKECLLALNHLGIVTSSWDAILIQVLIKKIDRNMHIRYMQSLTNPKDVPVITEFLSFLELQFQSMEAVVSKEKTTQRAVSSITASNSSDTGSCNFCHNGGHKIYFCTKFLQLSEAERLRWIQQQKRCVNCLKSDHTSGRCTSSPCKRCGKKHNTLLHLQGKSQKKNISSNQTAEANSFKPETKATASNTAAVTSASTNVVAGRQGYVFLATARVIITAANGASDEFRAVLDSGSQLNFITERVVKRLGISTHAASIYVNGIGSSNTKIRHRVNLALHSRVNNFTTRLEAAVLPHIIPPQPSQTTNIERWSIPKNITLADPDFNKPNNVDILLGAEFYHQLLSIGQIKLANDLPILQNTRLGWVIAGKLDGNRLSTATCGICTDDESSLEENIARLWELDDIKSADKNLSIPEKHCEEHFAHTHTIGNDGRFIVRIPFCDNPNTLGESHGIAFNRFLALERRLIRTPEIKAQYEHFMEEYEALSHMTQIDGSSICKPNYIIPHHCILRPQSETTKLRVVFDASAKTSSGLSLNDLMYTGPTVQSDLFSILLRFRLPRFVFTTDIEKMYRQMIIHPDDRAFQIIMWRKNPAMPIKYYQLNTITYGTRAAPYLATKCLQIIAEANRTRYPLGAQFLRDNFYVDDGIGGADSLNTALTIQRELIHILKKHGLNLQKWHSNHQQLLQTVTGDDREVDIDFNSGRATKTLGLTWIPKSDKFCVKVCLGQENRITKRTVSSDLARLFDPLGVLAPVTVVAKMFIQELWQLNLSWDEALPAEMHTRWMTFRNDLEELNNMQFSRHMFENHVPTQIQIHSFADASERAYGAAVYIRSVTKDGTVLVRLLCSKSRVAPLKKQTLPRLELCAALLCAQLTAKVKHSLNLDNSPTYLWTDSEIVLAWINSNSSSYQTFVANRISGIHELTIAEQWRHVRSKENPADVLSRGLSPRKLSTCNLWLYGPMFLHEKLLPSTISNTKLPWKNKNILELKKASAVVAVTSDATSMIYNINHRGSFQTLQQIVGYTLRFANHARKEPRQPQMQLTVQELERALVVIIQSMQEADFQDDLKQLKKYGEVRKGSQISNLSPFLDSNNIIRVGGRLDSSILPYDAKHPMLIPYNDPISKILFQMIHIKNRHCGPQALLSHIRQRFWPIKGKSMARSTVQHCIRCAKAKPKLLDQVMGNMPSTRVTPARPFINAGVDFCGPFWVHYKVRGKKPQKAYIAVFCCFATKAVHLELVSDLTTDAFIGSLKRFISRRGHCQNLYCDNATNFVGAKNQLQELSQIIFDSKSSAVINRECTSRGITFHFIPPRAPHFGGLWEAAVKSAKHLLVRSVSTASLTYEELDTIVIEIEGILNSRPISPMSNDPNDLAALTPGHFLIGEPLNAQIDTQSMSTKMSLLTRWKLVTHIKGEFWRRWLREYLCELQYRHKWKTQNSNIKPGDMVILKEENTAPLQWPMGRITNVYPGDDGIVRVVEVKTATGKCKRPIDRLALLPVNHEESIDPSNHPNINENPININKHPSNDESETLKQRRRTSSNPTLLFATLALISLPLVLGMQFQNTQFGTKLGMHFEGIGATTISPTEWQLIIYYDLNEFWKELQMFSNGTRALQHLCQELKERATCKNLVTHFERTESELVIDSTLLSGRRHKRGAVDLVGNIAHSLFGVLDSEYADNMAHTITQVKENKGHLLNLLKNQTSIVDSTINILKSDQEAVRAKFEHIENQLSQVYNRVYNVSDELYQELIYRVFSSLCMQLTIIAANLQRTQSSIFNVLTNTHHGVISPLLLTPTQLQHEVDKIRFHLPESLALPVKKEDSLQLYKLMQVKGGFTKNTVIFSIALPLIEEEEFKLFNIVPIPNWINNTMVSIKPCASLLAINTKRKQYFTLTTSELHACPMIKDETYIWSKGQIRYEQGSAVCACEINLFFNKISLDCALQRTNNHTLWIPLLHKNKWIYATPIASHATAVCKREVTQLTLIGSGLLSLEPQCLLKHNFMAIQGQQVISSTVNTSFTSIWEITDHSYTRQLKPLLNEINTTEYITQIKNLTALQNLLATQEIVQLPNKIQTQNYHNMTVGYTALLITCCLLIYLAFKQKSKKFPIPAPRTHYETTDFTVHI